MTAEEALWRVVAGEIEPQAVSVPGRTVACPGCGTSAWFGRRAFGGEGLSYALCKWCGYRVDLDASPEDFTLAIPVYHDCGEALRAMTWVEFKGEPYTQLEWTCQCGAAVRVWDSLRPYPRFGRDASLMEAPGR